MKTVADRYEGICRRMAEAAVGSRRPVGETALIGVVKGQSPERILEAYRAGLRDFAHSYVREALEAQHLKEAMPEARWHFIGPIQSNKTRHLQQGWHRVHSLDRLKIAKRLARAEVLVQVRLGGEASKSGVEPEQLCGLLEQLAESSSVLVKGLMTIPPPAEQFSPSAAFRQLAELATDCAARGLLPEAPELSMGMSGDFEAAVVAGAHWVRVGRLLFGDRESH